MRRDVPPRRAAVIPAAVKRGYIHQHCSIHSFRQPRHPLQGYAFPVHKPYVVGQPPELRVALKNQDGVYCPTTDLFALNYHMRCAVAVSRQHFKNVQARLHHRRRVLPTCLAILSTTLSGAARRRPARLRAHQTGQIGHRLARAAAAAAAAEVAAPVRPEVASGTTEESTAGGAVGAAPRRGVKDAGASPVGHVTEEAAELPAAAPAVATAAAADAQAVVTPPPPPSSHMLRTRRLAAPLFTSRKMSRAGPSSPGGRPCRQARKHRRRP